MKFRLLAVGRLKAEVLRSGLREIALVSALENLLAAELGNAAAGAVEVAAAALEEVHLLVVLLDEGVVLLVNVEQGQDGANHGHKRSQAPDNVSTGGASVFVVLAEHQAGATA